MNKGEVNICGSLRHSHWSNHAPIVPGSVFPKEAKLSIGQKLLSETSRWNGFARREELPKWQKGGWQEGRLQVDSFTEKGHDFPVPDGKAVRVLILQKPAGNFVNIITRDATPEEKKIHHRFPELVDLEEE